MKKLFTALILLSLSSFSCSSVRPSKPVYEKTILRAVPGSNTAASPDIKGWIKNAKPGNLVVLVQSKRGKEDFTPPIDDVLIGELKNKSIFTGVEVKPIESIDIWNVEDEIANCKKTNKQYVLLVSYYDNNAVTFNVFHSAFKTMTFNLYDLLPVFSYGIGAFNHYYTASLEATLIDVSSGFYVFNSNSTIFRERFSKGTSRTKLVENIYVSEIFRLVAKELALNVLSKTSKKD